MKKIPVIIISSSDGTNLLKSIDALKKTRFFNDLKICVIDNCWAECSAMNAIEKAKAEFMTIKTGEQIPSRYLITFAIRTAFKIFAPDADECIIVESGAIPNNDIEFINLCNAANEIDNLALAFQYAPTPKWPKIAVCTKRCYDALSQLGYFESTPLDRELPWSTLMKSMQSVGLTVVVGT